VAASGARTYRPARGEPVGAMPGRYPRAPRHTDTGRAHLPARTGSRPIGHGLLPTRHHRPTPTLRPPCHEGLHSVSPHRRRDHTSNSGLTTQTARSPNGRASTSRSRRNSAWSPAVAADSADLTPLSWDEPQHLANFARFCDVRYTAGWLTPVYKVLETPISPSEAPRGQSSSQRGYQCVGPFRGRPREPTAVLVA